MNGELSDGERRELLERLDRVPGAWRTCALAFLESQCWREELKGVGPQLTSETTKTAVVRRAPRRIRGTLVAVAATFLVALSLGPLWRGFLSLRPMPSATEVAGTGRNEDFLPEKPGRRAGSSGEASPVLAATSQTVRAPDDADRGQQWIRIPVTQHSSSEPLSSEPLWTVPAANADAVPSELRDVLERAGCQVRCFRQLLPGSMEDGRRVVVPVQPSRSAIRRTAGFPINRKSGRE